MTAFASQLGDFPDLLRATAEEARPGGHRREGLLKNAGKALAEGQEFTCEANHADLRNRLAAGCFAFWVRPSGRWAWSVLQTQCVLDEDEVASP